MRPEYDGIKFYSVNDWSIGENLKKAGNLLEVFDESESYTSVNKAIELYNVQELINCGIYPVSWDKHKIDMFKEVSTRIPKVLGRFFSTIDDDSFHEIAWSVCVGYVEDYWKLFVQFKVYKRVSRETFSAYIRNPNVALWKLLQQKELVNYYGNEFADVMRSSLQSPSLIISKFLRSHGRERPYYFPRELKVSEYEGILQKYVDSNTANFNDLRLLIDAQSTRECPISDKLRLSAKKVYDFYCQNPPATGIQVEYGISIEFADISEIKTFQRLENDLCKITYDVKWLCDNLDYPTILNNFKYVFDQFDDCWRSNLVSVKSQLGIYEKILSVRGVKEYIKGNHFNFMEALSTTQTKGYYDILKRNGVRLEDVLKWFFEEYLLQEFGANGFRFNAPSEGTTLVEKCRTIASEMDGILKQFCMYVREGRIDRELFEMSSGHIVFSDIPSFLDNKYIYENSLDIHNEQFYLFSDQSILCYSKNAEQSYGSFYNLLIQENVSFSDFQEYQKGIIQSLVEKNLLIQREDGCLKPSAPKAFILKDMLDHEVICSQYYDQELKKALDELIGSGDLRSESGLFSKPEQNYLNYELNKSSYSNGLDLRNKYVHSTYPEDKDVQRDDYFKLLKIMILIVTKINEEFCFREDNE